MGKLAVIGAGPAGWSAAKMLLESGQEVSQFSGGISLEDSQSAQNRRAIKQINSKLLFGSDYPYQFFGCGPETVQLDTKLFQSFADEGLSLVWGATMLPYPKNEIQKWPIEWERLEKKYEWISKSINISGRSDALDEIYGRFFNNRALLPTNRVLQMFERYEKLNQTKYVLGSARLAVNAGRVNTQGCIYCCLCLNGCPTGQIWSAPRLNFSNLNRIRNTRVLEIRKERQTYTITGIDKFGKIKNYYNFEKVFFAAGNIETFRILAASDIVEHKAILKDSATFFLPFMLDSKYGKASTSYYSLSQAFLRLPKHQANSSQIQFYDFSESLVDRARQSISLGTLVPENFLRYLLQKLFVGIGYLDSERSASIEMSLGKTGEVILKGDEESALLVRSEIQNVIRAAKPFFGSIGLRPLQSLTKYSLPGEGVHSGGWLPMGSGANELGSPKDFDDIHIVDSSVFPSISAGPITFTVMANAARIAEESLK